MAVEACGCVPDQVLFFDSACLPSGNRRNHNFLPRAAKAAAAVSRLNWEDLHPVRAPTGRLVFSSPGSQHRSSHLNDVAGVCSGRSRLLGPRVRPGSRRFHQKPQGCSRSHYQPLVTVWPTGNPGCVSTQTDSGQVRRSGQEAAPTCRQTKARRRKNKSGQKKRLSPPRSCDRRPAGETKHVFVCLPPFCVAVYKTEKQQH